jgi:hypothetical protein
MEGPRVEVKHDGKPLKPITRRIDAKSGKTRNRRRGTRDSRFHGQ